jgi:hypothetical protein
MIVHAIYQFSINLTEKALGSLAKTGAERQWHTTRSWYGASITA